MELSYVADWTVAGLMKRVNEIGVAQYEIVSVNQFGDQYFLFYKKPCNDNEGK